MLRFALVVSIIALLFVSCVSPRPAYDSAAVKAAMQSYRANFAALQPAIDAGDFAALEKAFAGLASAAKQVQALPAPMAGNPENWIKLNGEIEALAKAGSEAAVAKDGAKAKDIVGKIAAIMKAGHGEFRR